MSAVLDPFGDTLPLSSPRAGPGGTVRRSPADARGRGAGLAAVVAIHAAIGWAFASGLAQHVVEIGRRPIEASLVPQAPPPPPPPPPPKIERVRERPTAAPPPRAYVPPPEIAPPPAPAEPTITATQSEPAPPAPVAPPPAPPEPRPAIARQEISLACPGYQAVVAQGLEDAFDRVGVTGTVRMRLSVRGDRVVDAQPISGPREYYKYVQGAVKRMHCDAGGAEEVQVTLDVQFSR